MARENKTRTVIFQTILRAATVALATAIALALMPGSTSPAQAQTFKVIYNFTGGADGALGGALTIDAAGNLYGTGVGGGEGNCPFYAWTGCGTLFKLSRVGSGWVYTLLYRFSGEDGAYPRSLTFGPDGTLFGAIPGGESGGGGCGLVFNLRPAAPVPNFLAGWKETVLYRFQGGSDGCQAGTGDPVFDQAGNMYGTNWAGGPYGHGTVWKLTPSQGSWTESVIYSFQDAGDGAKPEAGLIFDKAGNLYGTTTRGGDDHCTVFKLTPSQTGWTEQTLHRFQRDTDGAVLDAGLIMDQAGNLYGGTREGGTGQGGTVFMLSPSGDNWTFNLLHSFSGPQFDFCNTGWESSDMHPDTESGGITRNLALDSAGNLYGATQIDGLYGAGSIFKLTPGSEGWTYTSLYDFTGGSDGQSMSTRVILDGAGNLYGATVWGGKYGFGVVWEITP